jgi:putative phage-type endonuclease
MAQLIQGTPEWIEARRSLVTATDLPILLGLSPYRCEADLADEKLGGPSQESTIRMRIGSALQGLIGEEYERQTGRRVVQFRKMHRHPTIEWAAASLDFRVIGERRIVEAKQTSSRSRFADGIPQDVEAQVAWQLGVTGYPVADIAVLTSDDLTVYEQRADPALFADLVAVAEDFRRRLEAGGPFARDAERIKRDYPADDGSEITADPEVTEAVRALMEARASRKRIEEREATLEAAIKTRMADAATLRGDGWHVTWKRTKDREETDWKSVAKAYRNMLIAERTTWSHHEPEGSDDLDAVESIHTNVREGFRPFRLVKETE